MIKINIENNNFVLGRLNTLSNIVNALTGSNRDEIRELINELKYLSMDVMVGDYKSELKFQLLNQIKYQVQKIIAFDKANDMKNSEPAMNLFSQIDTYAKESELQQSFSMIDSRFELNTQDI